MNRLFGRGKPKEPGPSINDCIQNVSEGQKSCFYTEVKLGTDV